MTKTLIYLDEIAIEVTKKPIKNINLRINAPEGTISVSSPFHVEESQLLQFLNQKKDWIKSKRYQLQRNPTPTFPELYSGKNIYFLGNKYTLSLSPTKEKSKIQIKGKHIFIYHSAKATVQNNHFLLLNWYKEQMAALIPKLIDKWIKIIPVPQPQWKIKQMRTRWGSCNVKTIRINLNLNLIYYPLPCLEYVLVHELIHLMEASHNARFYRLMDTYMKNWRTYKTILDKPLD